MSDMSAIHAAAQRQEAELRWYLLVVASVSRTGNFHADAALPIVRSVLQAVTLVDVERELTFLEEKGLLVSVLLDTKKRGRRMFSITSKGNDVVERATSLEDVVPPAAPKMP